MTEEEKKALEEAKKAEEEAAKKKAEEEADKKKTDPAEIIKNLKATTVPKKDFEELEKKYNDTLLALAEGEKIEVEKKANLTEEERNKRKDTLRKELYCRDSSLNNLDYWKKTLELRQLEIDSGKKDPFTGRGRTTSQDNVNQEEVSNNIAEVIQDCIDNCEGSNRVFTALLQNRLEDDPALALKLAKDRSSRRRMN